MNTNANSLTTSQWLAKATDQLKSAGISTARLDCLVLLEDRLGIDRSQLLAHPETELTVEDTLALNAQIKRRENHEPLAYIRGKSEFYGREFKVTPATLEPRPETETLISQFLTLIKDGPLTDGKNVNAVDVGTGSGCIAITCKLELPYLRFLATEINSDALEVARQNAREHKADITFHKGNLLEPIMQFIDHNTVLLCNLPYVPDTHTINQAAMQEPKVAIFGGEDGLELYRETFQQISRLSSKPAYVITESLPFQHIQLTEIALMQGYSLQKTTDFIQVFSCF